MIEQFENTHHSNHTHHRHRKHHRRHDLGKILAIIQLVASIVLFFFVFNTELLPVKWILALGIFLLIAFLATFFLGFRKKKGWRILGIILSILLTVGFIIGILYVRQVSETVEEVSNASYKIDNMIVAVRTKDPAQSILDASDYTFGVQTAVDQDNTLLMVKEVSRMLTKEIKIKEFSSIQELAQALLSREVNAAIYNEALTGLTSEDIEDYPDQIRILYQYGVKVELDEVALEKKDTSPLEPFNVYISGIDVTGDISKTSRSDVNIIMTVNPDKHKILLTTTPRDYYVAFPDLSGGERDKLTHAGIYGVDVSMNTLSELYQIKIPYYARVNFTSMVKIVNLLGGIDINNPIAFSSRGYDFPQGNIHLDGEAALIFSRERYSFSDGDNQRGRNQEIVLKAIIQKAMSPEILPHALDLLEEAKSCLQTNMTTEEIAMFVNEQLNNPAGWDIEMQAATGTGDKQKTWSCGDQELYVMWPDEQVVEDLGNHIRSVLEGR